MIISPSLGLRIWSSVTDPYDSAQLAENWARVDEHDHTPGKGNPITTPAIADGAITAAKIAPGTIPPPPSVANINSSQILDGAITGSKIAAGAISLDKTQTVASASVTRTVAQTVTGAGYVTAQFNVEDFDTGNMANLGVSNTRITIQTTGLYYVSSFLGWTVGGSYYQGFNAMRVVKNSATVVMTDTSALSYYGSSYSGLGSTNSGSTILRLTSGDYLELQAASDNAYYGSFNFTSANLKAGLIGL